MCRDRTVEAKTEPPGHGFFTCQRVGFAGLCRGCRSSNCVHGTVAEVWNHWTFNRARQKLRREGGMLGINLISLMSGQVCSCSYKPCRTDKRLLLKGSRIQRNSTLKIFSDLKCCFYVLRAVVTSAPSDTGKSYVLGRDNLFRVCKVVSFSHPPTVLLLVSLM